MPRSRTLQPTFSAGELDPKLSAREDFDGYYRGARTLTNFIVLPQGGLRRRGGLVHVDDLTALGVSGNRRLVPFDFGLEQTYVLVFHDDKFEVYTGDDDTHRASVSGTGITAAMVKEMDWTQSLDTLIVVHEDLYPPKKIVRGASHAAWTVSDLDLSNVPKHTFIETQGTGTPSGTTGSITISSTEDDFATADVGDVVRINDGEAEITAWTSATQVTATVTSALSGTGGAAPGAWFLDEATFKALTTNGARGGPRSTNFIPQGRLAFGGSKSRPDTVWLSKPQEYFDLDVGSGAAGDAIEHGLVTDQVVQIRQVFGGQDFEIYGDAITFSVSADNLTPADFDPKPVRAGIAENLRVFDLDGATIFVKNGGKALLEFIFSEADQKYRANPISLLSSHLIKNPADIAVRRSSSTEEADLVFLVNGDGTATALVALRGQDVTAFTPLVTRGDFKNVATESPRAGAHVHFVVERTINASANLYLERYDEDALLDACSVITTGLPSDTFSGLDHLEGETVKVIADGSLLGDETVASGAVTIDRPAQAEVQIGLDFSSPPECVSMPVTPKLPGGETLIGKKKRLAQISVRLHESKNCVVNGKQIAFQQFGEDLLDQPIAAFSGDKKIDGPLGWVDEATFEITQDAPLPLTILGISARLVW